MKVSGIHHVSMKCASAEKLEEVRRFYCGLLGMCVVREWPEGIMIDTGAGLIEVFCNGEGIPAKGAIRHIALSVDDVDAFAQAVRAAGHRVFIEPKDILIGSEPPVRARMAFCYGPLGEEIELFREM